MGSQSHLIRNYPVGPPIRGTRGKAYRGVRKATEASRLLDGAEAPLDETEVLIAWSEVYAASGATDAARAALLRARGLMALKGAEAVVRRIDGLLSPSQ